MVVDTFGDRVEFVVTDKEELDKRLREKVEEEFLSDEEIKPLLKERWGEEGLWGGEDSEFDSFDEFFDWWYDPRGIRGWSEDGFNVFSFNWHKYGGHKWDTERYQYSFDGFDGSVPDSFIIKDGDFSSQEHYDGEGIYDLLFNYGDRNLEKCMVRVTDGHVSHDIFSELVEEGLLVRKSLRDDLPFAVRTSFDVKGDLASFMEDRLNLEDESLEAEDEGWSYLGVNSDEDYYDILRDYDVDNMVIYGATYRDDSDSILYKVYINRAEDEIDSRHLLDDGLLLYTSWEFIESAVEEGVIVDTGLVDATVEELIAVDNK